MKVNQNIFNATILCERCGILAVAQMEGIPLCTDCLFHHLSANDQNEIQQRVSPLNLSYFHEVSTVSGAPA